MLTAFKARRAERARARRLASLEAQARDNPGFDKYLREMVDLCGWANVLRAAKVDDVAGLVAWSEAKNRSWGKTWEQCGSC